MTQPALHRRAALVLAVLAAVSFMVTAAVLVPWEWVPGGELRPALARDVFTSEQIASAEEFSGTVRRLSWASYAVSLGVATALGFTRAGGALVRSVGGGRWWVAVMVGVFVLLLVGRIATLPFALAVRSERLGAGLTDQSLGGWLTDRALALLVSWVMTSVVLLLVVWLARVSPRWWFAWAGGAAVAVTFVGSMLYPVAVEPLFNDFTPMAEGEFRDSVLALAGREGIDIDEVLVSDASRRTTTLNAYVSGIGDTRRVVVYDNLLEDLPPEQALSVVAHELAHVRFHDVLLGTTLGALGGLVGVALLALLLDSPRLRRRSGTAGPADPAVVAPVLALFAIGSLLASPIQGTISRAIEVRADRETLAVTQDVEAFSELQRQLALRSLADPTPPRWSHFWFGSHPTVLERLGLPAALEGADG